MEPFPGPRAKGGRPRTRRRRLTRLWACAAAAAGAAKCSSAQAQAPASIFRNSAYQTPGLSEPAKEWIFSRVTATGAAGGGAKNEGEQLNSAESTASRAKAGGGEGGGVAPASVSLPLYGSVHHTAYWFADVQIGSPEAQTQSLIADTGSSVMGFPCADCREKCGRHIDAPFDLAASASVKPYGCANACPLCAVPERGNRGAGSAGSAGFGGNAGSAGFGAGDAGFRAGSAASGGSGGSGGFGRSGPEQCAYHIRYTEGSSLIGKWFEDEVALDPEGGGRPFRLRAPFGCHAEETHLFVSQDASGILGLEATSRFGPAPFVTTALARLLNVAHRPPSRPGRNLGFSGSGHSDRSRPVFALCLSASGGVLSVGLPNFRYHAGGAGAAGGTAAEITELERQFVIQDAGGDAARKSKLAPPPPLLPPKPAPAAPAPAAAALAAAPPAAAVGPPASSFAQLGGGGGGQPWFSGGPPGPVASSAPIYYSRFDGGFQPLPYQLGAVRPPPPPALPAPHFGYPTPGTFYYATAAGGAGAARPPAAAVVARGPGAASFGGGPGGFGGSGFGGSGFGFHSYQHPQQAAPAAAAVAASGGRSQGSRRDGRSLAALPPGVSQPPAPPAPQRAPLRLLQALAAAPGPEIPAAISGSDRRLGAGGPRGGNYLPPAATDLAAGTGMRWTPLVMDEDEEGGWPGSYVAVLESGVLRGAAGESALVVPPARDPHPTRDGAAYGLLALIDSGTTLTYVPFLMYASFWTGLLRNVAAARARPGARRLAALVDGAAATADFHASAGDGFDPDAASGADDFFAPALPATAAEDGVVRVSGRSVSSMRQQLAVFIEALENETATLRRRRMQRLKRGAAAAPAADPAELLALWTVQDARRVADELAELERAAAAAPDQLPAEAADQVLHHENLVKEMRDVSQEQSARPRLLYPEVKAAWDRRGASGEMVLLPDHGPAAVEKLERQIVQQALAEAALAEPALAEPAPAAEAPWRRRRLAPVGLPNLDEECWYLADAEHDNAFFPDIKMTFVNGVEHIWRPTDYLYRKGKTKVFCLTIISDERPPDEDGGSAARALATRAGSPTELGAGAAAATASGRTDPLLDAFGSRRRRLDESQQKAVLGSSFFINHDLIFHLGRWEVAFAEALCPSTDLKRRLKRGGGPVK